MVIFPMIKTIQHQFIKVESYTDILSNDIVDEQAKEAANLAVDMQKYVDPNWGEYATLAVVDMKQ